MKLHNILLIGMSTLALTACKLEEFEIKAIETALGPDSSQPLPASSHLETNKCFVDEYSQPDAELARKIDILFITDTSGSLNTERPAIAENIDQFVQALPANADYNVAVMLGHGSRGPGSGKLHKVKSEPYVLKSSEMSLSEIRTHLVNKLKKVTTDSHSDGGEEGLYSLWRSLDNGMLTANQAHGFYRNDAALAVIFIADENDICARYPAGVKRVPDGQKDSKGREIELVAFDRDCGDVTPESVFAKVKLLMGERPLLISGILYNEKSVIPTGGEDEIGHGYLELIQLANGISIDLSGRRYHEGLQNIGSLATKKLTLITEHRLQTAQLSEIDPSTIQASVDGQSVTSHYESTTGSVHLTGYAGVERSRVSINYCLKETEPIDPPIVVEPPVVVEPPIVVEPPPVVVVPPIVVEPPVVVEPPPPVTNEPPVVVEPPPRTFTDNNGDGLDDVTGLPAWATDNNHDGLDDVTGEPIF